MARITVEDCLEVVNNRFELVLMATKRARQLANGAEPLVESTNDKPTVLSLREIAVWVGVAAAHRDEAFKACRYIIDEVKHRVPIWKKEHYEHGDSGWVNCERCATHAHDHDHRHDAPHTHDATTHPHGS